MAHDLVIDPRSTSEEETREATAEAAAPRRRGRVRAGGQWLVYAAPIATYLAAGYAHRWITDDGFIYLRVVRQIRSGNGPVFNAGERVEAFTGTLWVMLLAGADLLTPVRLEWLAVLLGLGCGAAGIALAMAGARRLAGAHAGWFVPFGAIVFVAVTPVWVFATSGLETGLVFGWLGACLWVLARWATAPHPPLSPSAAVVLGLGWLIRPELALFSAAFVALVVAAHWRDGRRRHGLHLLAAAAALPAAYQLFRMGYFASLVPNTAIAKEAGDGRWSRGWAYLRDFADPYWLWVPALGLALGGYLPLAGRLHTRRARLVVATFAVGGLADIAYMVTVGGDYIHARLLLPGFFAVCVPVAVIPVTRRHLAGLVIAPWAIAAVLTLRPDQWGPEGWFANGFALVRSPGQVTIDDYGWGDDGPHRSWYTGEAVYQERTATSYTRLDAPLRDDIDLPLGTFTGIGLVGYAMGPDFTVLDVLGLADGLTAHLDSTPADERPGLSLAGHEKPLPRVWIAARLTAPASRPDPDAFLVDWARLLDSSTGSEFQEQVAWARAALECDEIVTLRTSIDAPLTPGRFADNVRLSFGNTRLRIPADPSQAYRRFCGTETPEEVRTIRDG